MVRTQGSWEHRKGNRSLSGEAELDNRYRQLLLGNELQISLVSTMASGGRQTSAAGRLEGRGEPLVGNAGLLGVRKSLGGWCGVLGQSRWAAVLLLPHKERLL